MSRDSLQGGARGHRGLAAAAVVSTALGLQLATHRLTLVGRAEQAPYPIGFAGEVAAFLSRDRQTPPPSEGILFIGSSIFRLWSDLFGAPHLTALALVVVANLVVWRLRRVPHVMVHVAFRFALALTIATASVAYLLWRVSANLWDIRVDLPLHLCDVMALVTVALLVTKHRPLYDFVYFLGIGGALQALLTSNVGAYGSRTCTS